MNDQRIHDQNVLRIVKRAYARAHETLSKLHVGVFIEVEMSKGKIKNQGDVLFGD